MTLNLQVFLNHNHYHITTNRAAVSTINERRLATLIHFTDIEGHQIWIPAPRVSHWSLDTGGGMRIWAVGGGVHHPMDGAIVREQLEAAGLLDTRVSASEFSRLAPPPDEPSPPPARRSRRRRGLADGSLLEELEAETFTP